ncbi:MAG: CrcB family protein [Dehalococcoidia bacterium]
MRSSRGLTSAAYRECSSSANCSGTTLLLAGGSVYDTETRRRILERVLLIAGAGALGAVTRYGVQSGFNNLFGGPSVTGTFVVNVSGAFLLGLLIALGEGGFLPTGPWRNALGVGFLGAYTTFSTLMLETATRGESGSMDVAVFYLTSSIAVGLVAVYGGLLLGRALN